jgi:hypothetical protein
MRLQELKARRFWLPAVLLGLVVAAIAYMYVFTSPQYEAAVNFVRGEAVAAKTGRLRTLLLMGSRVTSQDGRNSSFTFYLWGATENGMAEVEVNNDVTGHRVVSATFDGESLLPTPMSGR